HAEHARPHGQRRFRNLHLQRRGGGGIRPGGAHRRPTPLPPSREHRMSLPTLDGRVAWVFQEDDYDIDLIVGIKNIKITDIHELARLAMASYDPDFASTVARGDLL